MDDWNGSYIDFIRCRRGCRCQLLRKPLQCSFILFFSRPRTKGVWFGPMKVISNLLSEYVLLDLVTKKEKNIHVKRIKQFHFSPTADPLDIARRDYLEFFVEEILAHRGNVKKVSTLQFFVKWQGYPDSSNSWESWANLRLVTPLHEYLRSHQLSRLIPPKISAPTSS
jgi:Chromo (CHRromatin Organisation MOdifier) domain